MKNAFQFNLKEYFIACVRWRIEMLIYFDLYMEKFVRSQTESYQLIKAHLLITQHIKVDVNKKSSWDSLTVSASLRVFK